MDKDLKARLDALPRGAVSVRNGFLVLLKLLMYLLGYHMSWAYIVRQCSYKDTKATQKRIALKSPTPATQKWNNEINRKPIDQRTGFCYCGLRPAEDAGWAYATQTS